MAGNWHDPNQYPYQQPAGYQHSAPDAAQQAMYQQNAGYNAAAYQQYYAQQYGAAQGYQQHAWAQGQYQQYPQQAGWNPGYPTLQNQPAFQQPQYQPQNAPVSWPSNMRGVSCYNCGAKDHWAASCQRPARSAFGQIGPMAPVIPSGMPAAVPYPAQLPGGHKGPVVTKYAVPPHIAAQMKARGVPGAASMEPNAPGLGYGAQHSDWQQWHGRATDLTTYQAHPGMQGSSPPQTSPQPGPHVQAPPPSAPIQPQLAGSSTTESYFPQGEKHTSDTQSPSTTAQPAGTAHHTETEQENGEKEEEDDDDDDDNDLGLLDIPDLPKSYGTPSYSEPKLLAKPLYALAPEWTQAGFGEVTLCEDPAGRTASDYIKSSDPDAVLRSQRTPAHDEDPIFATIDVDTLITKEGRSGSRDSCKTGYETPSTFESAETLPTSIEDTDENVQAERGSTPAQFKSIQNRSVTNGDSPHRTTMIESSDVLKDKKRKHEHEDNDDVPDSKNAKPDAKKIRSDNQASSTESEESQLKTSTLREGFPDNKKTLVS